MRQSPLLTGLILSLTITSLAFAQDKRAGQSTTPATQAKSTWLFLGDSITHAGHYVAFIDAALRTQFGTFAPRVLNMGVPSETASGLSEPDHPFRRPNIHSRLEKTLALVQPDIVFVCYGMNDGIYHPAAPDIQAAYETGMIQLALRVKSAGARLILLTPPPFEPSIAKQLGNLGPSEDGKFAWFAAAPDYDHTLEKMSQWCLENPLDANAVIDLREPLNALKQAMRETDAHFSLTSDGIHPRKPAHEVIGFTILTAMGMMGNMEYKDIPPAEIELSVRRSVMLRDAYLSAAGKNRPGLSAGLPITTAKRLAAKMTIAQ